MTRVALSLGSNVDRERSLAEAIGGLSGLVEVVAVSSAYETVPVGPVGQPPYLNAAALVTTDLTPETLKYEILRPLEASLGRVRGTDKHHPRTIDIDITLWADEALLLDGCPLPDPDLLRHLHLALPLAEIAPDLKHPVSGESMAEIARRLGAPESR